jgi:hypothetical protein
MLIRTAPQRVQRTAATRPAGAERRTARLAAASQPAGERRLGHDFGAVRLHHDDTAEATSSALGARAWTLGDHVAFGHGEYRPGHDGYRRLLAHELAHVLQQTDVGQPSSMSIAPPGDAFEREADRIAAAAMSAAEPPSRHLPVSAGPATVRRALQTDPPVSVQENLAERIVAGGQTAGFVLLKLNGKYLNLKDNPDQHIDPTPSMRQARRCTPAWLNRSWTRKSPARRRIAAPPSSRSRAASSARLRPGVIDAES